MKSTTIRNTKSNKLSSYLKYILERQNKYFLYWKQLLELNKIIERQEIRTLFQPIIDIQQNNTFAYEALNRPNSTKLFPNPDAFYEFVGRTNHVFYCECLCRNLSLQRFQERLTDEMKNENPVLFINIHPNVLLDKNYHSGETRQLLKDLGLQPQQVVFELTERSAVTDYDEFERVLNHYRAQGYRIAVDDVGSGYNSLKTLIFLKPEFIKIDRSLIQSIDENIPQQQLLSVLLNYAEQSETKVIAEGVERFEEYSYLKQAGVHYAQGFALGRPDERIQRTQIIL
ncbi:EAL domain-containing protein [Lysinibacillus sp. 54212]|uniref:EAL domain-containing protein n=1 Tax=Lysinibacillus sp. 54212 TaxID=3119829 RepID=UPI002FC5D762